MPNAIALAQSDLKRFTQELDLTFTAPGVDPDVVTVKGLGTKHHLAINPNTGLTINSKRVHISVAESLLTDESYTTRDSNDQVNLINHKVSWKDERGVSKTYRINETWPDEGLGMIICILGVYK